MNGSVAVEVDGGNILLGVSHGWPIPPPQPTLSLRTVHCGLAPTVRRGPKTSGPCG